MHADTKQKTARPPRGSARSVVILPAVVAILFCAAAGPVPAATIVVNSEHSGPADEPGECTLHSAITSSNLDTADGGCTQGDGFDRIEFSGVSYIYLEESLPIISSPVEIRGPGMDHLIIDGDDRFVQLTVQADGTTVGGLTLFQGYTQFSGGCIRALADDLLVEEVRFDSCQALINGGGFSVFGDRSTVRSSYFSQNRASSSGGAHFRGLGHLVDRTTFFANRTTSNGGAIFVTSEGDVDILRSTFYANHSDQSGGAISLSGDVLLIVNHSTFAENIADYDGNGSGQGGAVYVFDGRLSLINSLVADNRRGTGGERSDLFLSPVPPYTPELVVYGGCLVSSNAGAESAVPAGMPNASGALVGTAAAPLDAELLPLAMNGGPTPTVLSTSTTLVIDQGFCPGETLDQRGFGGLGGTRVVDGGGVAAQDGCDIGAVEMGAFDVSSIVFVDGFESGDIARWQ